MFNLFKKKTFAYPKPSAWEMSSADYDGRLLSIRQNTSAVSLVENPAYRYSVSVSIPLKNPDEQGQPIAPESATTTVIEDRLRTLLEANEDALHVLSVATNGVQEFIFYSRQPATAKETIKMMKEQIDTHDLQSYVAEDPTWSVYKQFARH